MNNKFDELNALAYQLETTEREYKYATDIEDHQRVLFEIRQLQEEFIIQCKKYFLTEEDYYYLNLDELNYDEQYNGDE